MDHLSIAADIAKEESRELKFSDYIPGLDRDSEAYKAEVIKRERHSMAVAFFNRRGRVRGLCGCC